DERQQLVAPLHFPPFVAAVFDGCKCSKIRQKQRTACPRSRSSAKCGNMPGPVMLIIRDGWGINPGGPEKRKENGNATLLPSTPFHDCLYRDYPWSRLSASGI